MLPERRAQRTPAGSRRCRLRPRRTGLVLPADEIVCRRLAALGGAVLPVGRVAIAVRVAGSDPARCLVENHTDDVRADLTQGIDGPRRLRRLRPPGLDD